MLFTSISLNPASVSFFMAISLPDPDNGDYAVISIYWYLFSSILFLQDIQSVLSFVQL